MTARQSSDKRYSFSYPKDEIIPTIANLELQYVHLQQVFIMLRQDYENSKHYLPGARITENVQTRTCSEESTNKQLT
ncbi:uncharacterized protein LOC121380154 isoform X2 [Gigantopelta aegis]|uniref:uncharacterized protein LOC121380154 isoform X2 n=1 Tax=Gigantopelta aegis TaxID=1735272 RepID=UPI001B888099|nr:uncharacterized protein LOC121380154 isoform X2 [Gigantopelta aegis]